MRALFFAALFCSHLFCDSGFLDSASAVYTDMVIKKIEKSSQKESSPEVIKKAARKNGVDERLALSIAKVESNFNPFAVSGSDALGLMQLKLDTAVRDLFESSYRSGELPSREDLFDPALNADLGTAYLRLLGEKYLKDIVDNSKKEYCLIASYNAGAGTVLRTFSQDKAEAVRIINSLGSDEVLKMLMFEMPSEQGRRYILKVLEAKREYSNLFFKGLE